MEEENLYLEATKWDVISKCAGLFASGSLHLRSDYKIAHKHETPDKNITWLFNRHSDRNCILYHRVAFKLYNMVHSRCFNCWKIVAAPRTLSELMKIWKLQQKLDFSAKCGIEGHRLNSDKLYAGYWYNNSQEEGQKRYDIIRKAIDEEISPDMPLILKRACTEFEQALGASDEWKMAEGQKDLEYIWEEAFVTDTLAMNQSYHFRMHVFSQWIHHAFEHGDETYLEFTGGNPLFRKLKTYHQEK